jgi:uncharacterized protein
MTRVPFLSFLYLLREQGLAVGVGEWLSFTDALRNGLITSLDDLYALGRALLCRSETEFDAFDVAFAGAFQGADLPPDVVDKLKAWLANARTNDGEWVQHDHETLQDLWKAFLERLEEQQEEHHGGSHWVGTGGTSPFGNSGRGAQGVRVGGSGGGRQAVQVAMERQWANYRTDRILDTRDLQVALRALRNLAREGSYTLDLDGTIDATAKNAGDIELVEHRDRVNRVHVVLIMDAGGSMSPHYERVNQLFSAANAMKQFKSFEALYFHNCVYQWLYEDMEQLDRKPTRDVLDKLTPNHRLIFVGDASMAPFELFNAYGWNPDEKLPGIDWLRLFQRRCKASVWLNPDPPRFWQHPTVSAIGNTFPMYELTIDGLTSAVKKLRAPI